MRRLQPSGNGNLELRDGFGRRLAVRRAEPEIRRIGDPASLQNTWMSKRR